jgi:hypothetical protein
VRQFTLISSWWKFYQFAISNAKVDMIIRSAGGVPILVDAFGS